MQIVFRPQAEGEALKVRHWYESRSSGLGEQFIEALEGLIGRIVVSYQHPRLGFAITSPLNAFAAETINRRKPGALHHLAFSAPSRAAVDAIVCAVPDGECG